MTDLSAFAPFANDAVSAAELLQGLISPVPAQSLVASPPDSPPRTKPGESTPVTGSLAMPPSQADPKVSPADEDTAQGTRPQLRTLSAAGGMKDGGADSVSRLRRGLAAYFSQHPLSGKGAAAVKGAARSQELLPEIWGATNQLQPLGGTDPASGRVITQPFDNPAVNQALATDAMAKYRAGLQAAVRGISGAKLSATRDIKNPQRLAEKIVRERQPAQTVSDYGAAQISVDSLQAKDAVIAAIRTRFPVLREQDHFSQGDPAYGYRAYSMQVQMPNGSSQELQILPREIFEANQKEHREYKAARNAQLAGRNADVPETAARRRNNRAMEQFKTRNIAKGAAVTLKDGSRGVVAYLDPQLKIARVRTEDGRNITVRRGDLSS